MWPQISPWRLRKRVHGFMSIRQHLVDDHGQHQDVPRHSITSITSGKSTSSFYVLAPPTWLSRLWFFFFRSTITIYLYCFHRSLILCSLYKFTIIMQCRPIFFCHIANADNICLRVHVDHVCWSLRLWTWVELIFFRAWRFLDYIAINSSYLITNVELNFSPKCYPKCFTVRTWWWGGRTPTSIMTTTTYEKKDPLWDWQPLLWWLIIPISRSMLHHY